VYVKENPENPENPEECKQQIYDNKKIKIEMNISNLIM